jgi:hypothetical protein
MERLTETSLEHYLRIEWAHFDQVMEKEFKKFDDLKKGYKRKRLFNVYSFSFEPYYRARLEEADLFFGGEFETDWPRPHFSPNCRCAIPIIGVE